VLNLKLINVYMYTLTWGLGWCERGRARIHPVQIILPFYSHLIDHQCTKMSPYDCEVSKYAIN